MRRNLLPTRRTSLLTQTSRVFLESNSRRRTAKRTAELLTTIYFTFPPTVLARLATPNPPLTAGRWSLLVNTEIKLLAISRFSSTLTSLSLMLLRLEDLERTALWQLTHRLHGLASLLRATAHTAIFYQH